MDYSSNTYSNIINGSVMKMILNATKNFTQKPRASPGGSVKIAAVDSTAPMTTGRAMGNSKMGSITSLMRVFMEMAARIVPMDAKPSVPSSVIPHIQPNLGRRSKLKKVAKQNKITA